MNHRRVTAISLASAIAVLAFAVPASGAPIRECGNYGWKNGAMRWTFGSIDGAGTFNVTSRVVGCRTARRVATRSYPNRQVSRWYWRGWSCRELVSRHEYSDNRCTRSGGRVVRWQTAS